ncbi:MAG: acyl carrier protein [Clostridia bacterium]|nr:acyl carrier protein [Clostridia bacterium]
MNTIEKVKSLIRKEFNIDDIADNSNLELELNINSLDRADLIYLIEDEFGVYIEDGDLYSFQTVAELANLIDSYLAAEQDI